MDTTPVPSVPPHVEPSPAPADDKDEGIAHPVVGYLVCIVFLGVLITAITIICLRHYRRKHGGAAKLPLDDEEKGEGPLSFQDNASGVTDLNSTAPQTSEKKGGKSEAVKTVVLKRNDHKKGSSEKGTEEELTPMLKGMEEESLSESIAVELTKYTKKSEDLPTATVAKTGGEAPKTEAPKSDKPEETKPASDQCDTTEDTCPIDTDTPDTCPLPAEVQEASQSEPKAQEEKSAVEPSHDVAKVPETSDVQPSEDAAPGTSEAKPGSQDASDSQPETSGEAAETSHVSHVSEREPVTPPPSPGVMSRQPLTESQVLDILDDTSDSAAPPDNPLHHDSPDKTDAPQTTDVDDIPPPVPVSPIPDDEPRSTNLDALITEAAERHLKCSSGEERFKQQGRIHACKL